MDGEQNWYGFEHSHFWGSVAGFSIHNMEWGSSRQGEWSGSEVMVWTIRPKSAAVYISVLWTSSEEQNGGKNGS